MFSRTYDAQRHSPLTQITQTERRAAARGVQEGARHRRAREHSAGLSRRDVSAAAGRDAAGDQRDAPVQLIWEHKRPSGRSLAKTIAIYEDMIYQAAPDGFIVALDARTGAVRWETKTSGRLTSGVVVVDGKVISGRACNPRNEDCYIVAHDAKTGKELWKFYTAARSNEPGGDTWGGAPDATRAASTWGLAGAYDPAAPPADLGRRQSDAEHPRQPSRRQLRRDPDVRRRPTCTATRRSRSTSIPASSRGTTSTCRATTGTRTTPTSARCSGRRSVRIRSSSSGSTRTSSAASSATSRRWSARAAGCSRSTGTTGSFCGRRRFRSTRRTS